MSLEELKKGRTGGSADRRIGKSQTAEPPIRRSVAEPGTVASEVSLRGIRIDEAEAILTKALDDAILADLPYLRVIHGKGTGAMRRMVHEMVAHDPRVRRFALAPANQGGAGVTIVEFGS